MERVAACVIIGGQGSVQTAMTCGTPFVGMPYHGEQELNVALAESRGMATRMSPLDGGTSRMTEAVRRLIDDPQFRASAQRVKSHYAGIDGVDNCARAIIEYIDHRSGKQVIARRVHTPGRHAHDESTLRPNAGHMRVSCCTR